MIVDRHTAHRIVTGEITQTRLPFRPWRSVPLGSTRRSYSQRLPQVGKYIEVRRDTAWGDMAGHVLVTACRLGTAHEDTLADGALRALGYDGEHALPEYITDWLLGRDTSWLANRAPDDQTYATTMDAALHAVAELDADQLVNRWDRRWARASVWIVQWKTEEPPAYLAGPPRVRYVVRPSDGRHVVDDDIRDQDRGYYGDSVRPVPQATELADRGITHDRRGALVDAGEYLDKDDLKPKWERDAAQRHAGARGGRSIAQALGRRLRGS